MQNVSHCSGIKAGDTILLNEKARAWTRDTVFRVDEVKAWGVICTAGEGTDIPYRATWEQIDRIVYPAVNYKLGCDAS